MKYWYSDLATESGEANLLGTLGSGDGSPNTLGAGLKRFHLLYRFFIRTVILTRRREPLNPPIRHPGRNNPLSTLWRRLMEIGVGRPQHPIAEKLVIPTPDAFNREGLSEHQGVTPSKAKQPGHFPKLRIIWTVSIDEKFVCHLRASYSHHIRVFWCWYPREDFILLALKLIPFRRERFKKTLFFINLVREFLCRMAIWCMELHEVITSDRDYLAAIAAEINDRPRKILDWKKPSEAFADLLTNASTC
jgi:hypothetical protein